ncbi:MAG: hypothetical protein QNK23_11400 [Crocinitomicaceae bacterium]|nr:hypothetical protein [Crocinitomicaceae bacterium]
MRTLLIASLFSLFSFMSFSQDVIFMKDGSKIEAKVIEITSSSIKYNRYDQPDGPSRTVYKSKVKEIIYENGTWDNFESVEEEPTAEPVRTPPTRTSRRKEKDFMFSPGFSFEGMLTYGMEDRNTTGIFLGYDQFGYAIYGTSTERVNYIGINLRLGSKWYFGKSEKYRPGIQVSWLRLALLINPDGNSSQNPIGNLFAPVNAGFTNAIKFNENLGMEVNASVGFVILDLVPPPFFSSDQNVLGIMYGVEAKFRYDKLAIGFDYSRVEGNLGDLDRRSMNLISLSVGAKF